MNEEDKIKLTGRIYTAIQKCVNNRYKIVAGYFAIVGFLVIKDNFLKKFIDSYALVFLSIIFTFFVFLNFLNYWFQAPATIHYTQSHMVQLQPSHL